MGMTVLYIAFGFVALWLLAEVLMQYKARLRWRLLAFAGFLGVVAGVVLPSVLVIAAGALAFAAGQTLVTLSFRKGFVAGWALRRGKAAAEAAPQQNRRRRSAGGPRPEPALQVTALEYGPDSAAEDSAEFAEDEFAGAGGGSTAGSRPAAEQGHAGDQQFYAAQPMDEDTGSYGVQSFETASFASPFTAGEQDSHQYAAYYEPQGQGGYDYTTGYPAPGEQQVYAAYSDPYIGTGGAVAPQQPYEYPQPTAYGGYAPDPYAAAQQQYSMDTPPGGVWVPQQRSTDGAAPGYPAEEQQQYPYQGTNEYDQYRY
ncbi:hypothetical protein J7E97_18400 [Streptomyces sp. ISL-66]|uniref:hypothetical protein n=1 Tax=Streptomyces sp. ISL-66 TaxID=2819186 RepID=UPI001BE73492|nr:hypothetical protein [Streptomyces sp. ISL-66]MBT2469794.1 hypothetical protein [Streptomyces sp. ISL-66]